jgi:deferrochelatase/peroxidase EfeB
VTSRRLSRRRLLVAAGGAVGAAAAGGALAADGRSAAADTITFDGPHQAGIVTPQQAHLRMTAFDLNAGREDLRSLLRRWTAAARLMAVGHELGATHGQWSPPVDTGEASGLPPARLTMTVGFGPTLFAKAGLRHRRPAQLADLPRFPGDDLDPARSNGDLCIQACADDPQVAFHAIRNMARIGLGTVELRWTQSGFLSRQGDRTPRNLMGFKDGTANLDPDDGARMRRNVWAAASDGQAWMAGGSYLVSRRIRIRIEAWDRSSLHEQEHSVGRRKGSGAPFGGHGEHDPVRISETPVGAHIRLANPRSGAGSEDERILRRGYSFDDGMVAGLTQADAGLMFLAYQRDPRRQFVTIQRRLAASDKLGEYLLHTSSGVWAIPPGSATDGYVGQSLLG